MVQELKRQYFFGVTPPVAIFIALGLLQETQVISLSRAPMQIILAPVIFIAAIVTGVALPVWLRTLFAHRRRNQYTVSSEDFLRFQRQILYSAIATPYLALAAFLLVLPPVHFFGTVLAALYAAYYYYPSEKRIRFDRHIFKIQP
jgi:hypothetical protein